MDKIRTPVFHLKPVQLSGTDLNEKEKEMLKDTLLSPSGKYTIVAFSSTEKIKTMESLIDKGLMKKDPEVHVSPYHDIYILTRKGRKIARQSLRGD